MSRSAGWPVLLVLLLAEEAADGVGDAAERAVLERIAKALGDVAEVKATEVETALGDVALDAVDDLGEGSMSPSSWPVSSSMVPLGSETRPWSFSGASARAAETWEMMS